MEEWREREGSRMPGGGTGTDWGAGVCSSGAEGTSMMVIERRGGSRAAASAMSSSWAVSKRGRRPRRW